MEKTLLYSLVGSTIRTVIKCFGAAWGYEGVMTNEELDLIAGLAVIIIGQLWSFGEKWNRRGSKV